MTTAELLALVADADRGIPPSVDAATATQIEDVRELVRLSSEHSDELIEARSETWDEAAESLHGFASEISELIEAGLTDAGVAPDVIADLRRAVALEFDAEAARWAQ